MLRDSKDAGPPTCVFSEEPVFLARRGAKRAPPILLPITIVTDLGDVPIDTTYLPTDEGKKHKPYYVVETSKIPMRCNGSTNDRLFS